MARNLYASDIPMKKGLSSNLLPPNAYFIDAFYFCICAKAEGGGYLPTEINAWRSKMRSL